MLGQGRARGLAMGLMVAMVALGSAFDARPAAASETPTRVLDQGWNATQRDAFYWTSQGSQMMPYAWFAALERPDSTELFLADNLARFGYLPPHASPLNKRNLPVGFTTDMGRDKVEYVGMTCGACHTGQVEHKGTAIRLDGAPTDADFWSFLRELTRAMEQTGSDPQKFDRFARRVLGQGYSDSAAARLRGRYTSFAASFTRFQNAALPDEPWGPARLDAFGMIFNRVAGLDLNQWQNVQPADAPVSYPFMWNAHPQDKIQWNLSAPNGNDLFALTRNTGEVLGVFAQLDICRKGKTAYGDLCVPLQKPRKFTLSKLLPNLVFYSSSASLSGLMTLENSVKALKPPPWPSRDFGTPDPGMVEQGRGLFAANCASCHAMSVENNRPGHIWKVEKVAVGTDQLMAVRSMRVVDTGILEGTLNLGGLGGSKTNDKAMTVAMTAPAAPKGWPQTSCALPAGVTIPPTLPESSKYGPKAPAVNILTNAVAGAILDGYVYPNPKGSTRVDVPKLIAEAGLSLVEQGVDGELAKLEHKLGEGLARAIGETYADGPVGNADDPDKPAYESRPLYGVWATGPYLHNGSVPTLYDLLKPGSQRPATFRVVRRSFNPEKVGLDTDAAGEAWTFDTSKPGNCNLGHDGDTFTGIQGRPFTEEEIQALIAYMKTLDGPEDL